MSSDNQEQALPCVSITRSFAAFLLHVMTSSRLPVQSAPFALPPLNINEFLDRFREYLRCSDNCYILAGVYLTKFLQARPDVTINTLNAHRLGLVSLVTAAKYLDDVYHTNVYYACVGGISLQSFNNMEREFVFSLRFSLFVSDNEFAKQQKLQSAISLGLDVPALASIFHQRGVLALPTKTAPLKPKANILTYHQLLNGVAILAAASMGTLSSQSSGESSGMKSVRNQRCCMTGIHPQSALEKVSVSGESISVRH